MPPKIYNIKEPLDLDRLRLTKPINKNGSHFIKTLDIDDPIYFLGPKCLTKQGFVKSGKKVFCDFVFSNEDSEFLAWLENLEENARTRIYDNREKWFETPLDEHDIESSMSPPYRSYKSGKYFIVRANVPTTLDKINIKVYDENEQETSPDNIKENTKVLAVLEFQGIRCSVRSFQFEIELKQLLIVEPEKLFESCIIGKSGNKNKKTNPDEDNAATQEQIVSVGETANESLSDKPLHEEPQMTFATGDDINNKAECVVEEESRDHNTTIARTPERISVGVRGLPKGEVTREDLSSKDNEPEIEPVEIHLDAPEPVPIAVEIFDEDFSPEPEKDQPLKLKSRNDVYYKLYKEMRQRAKEAKREALTNYLEAKRIKNTYLLEDLSDSESDEEGFNAEYK